MLLDAQNAPKVSIIVPVYAVEGYIAQCAGSLFSQTWKNLEYIFVDNGTPDMSIDILCSVVEEFPERKNSVLMLKEERKGLGYTRMTGIRKATGDYIIHVDSDDWVEPDFIEKMVMRALETEADCVYCDYYKEYEGHPEKTKVAHENDFDFSSPADILSAIHNGRIQAYMWNKLVKRSLYHLDTFVTPIRNMHEDIAFQTQVLYNAGKMVHLSEPLVHYRRKRGGAITAGSWSHTRRSSAEGLLYLYSHLPQTGSPLDYIGQDLVMRAGWYCISTFNFATLKACPPAVRFLAGMDYKTGRRVPLCKQRIMKAYCRLLMLKTQ